MRMHKNILGGGHLLGTSGALLALLIGAMLFPTTPDAAQAEEATEASPRATTSVSLNVPATIEFTDVMATPDGATTTASAKIGVTTTASAGYKLYLYAEDNSLKSLNPSTTQSITSASASSLNNFTNNTWGYNLTEGTTAGTTYSALPTTNTTPTQTKDTSTTNSANDTYTLSLGAKVDSTIPSGTYTSTLTISVVAEPRKLTLSDISNMQDMTPEICAASSENETKRLIDTRDQKLYWVAKLKDGNCWMTQNLDFDIPEGGLTNENGLAAKTNLPDGTVWDSSSDYAPQPTTTGSIFSSTSNTGTYSFDPGMYVNNNPTAWTYCDNYWSGGSCSNWTNVSNMPPMTEIRDESTSIVDTNSNTYDAHYLAGNYYQYTAATAGTGEQLTSNDTNNATGSICPKGWKLPTSGNSNSGSFSGLTNKAYGITSSTVDNITESPLYFIPAGRIDSGSLLGAGNLGYYWSSTVSYYAFYLSFSSGRVYPSTNGGFQDGGFPVRCLAS